LWSGVAQMILNPVRKIVGRIAGKTEDNMIVSEKSRLGRRSASRFCRPFSNRILMQRAA
jgi:hypothetical protein